MGRPKGSGALPSKLNGQQQREKNLAGVLLLRLLLWGNLLGDQELSLMGLLLGRNVLGEQESSLMGLSLGEKLGHRNLSLGRNALGGQERQLSLHQSLGIKMRW
ncbi:hypothetical protein T484DRAFT_1874728 [Baffinella frigidus]|nr:hypothetical protein T484DRAFT_1874728 [Cryptophyta sp. CCMP2293]